MLTSIIKNIPSKKRFTNFIHCERQKIRFSSVHFSSPRNVCDFLWLTPQATGVRLPYLLPFPPPTLLPETGGRRSGESRVSSRAIVMGAKLLLRPVSQFREPYIFKLGPSTCLHNLQHFGGFKFYKLEQLPLVNPPHLLARNFCTARNTTDYCEKVELSVVQHCAMQRQWNAMVRPLSGC